MAWEYDMVVIGGGAAGLTAGGMSALLGAKTMLVESTRLGGECTWTGCIPSKTLLHAAKLAHQTRHAARLGIGAGDQAIDFGTVMKTVHTVRESIYEAADAPPNLEKLGVEFAPGLASFEDSHTIQIVEKSGRIRKVSSRFFVIATGSRPSKPKFDAPVLTNETVFEITELPRRLVVVGGGPVGIEMAQAFRRLGSQVTVIVRGSDILPKDDPALSRMLLEKLRSEDVRFFLGRTALAAQSSGSEIAVTLDDGQVVWGESVLAAIGREPNVESLGLKQQGIRFNHRGIVVDDHCRTSVPHIYAAGDVTGKYQFTHMAEHMGKIAINNAILRFPRRLDSRHVTWCTFSDPELASVGLSEHELRRTSMSFNVHSFPFQKLDRAATEGETTGLIKVFASRRGKILGATILGKNAGEMISEWALAMRHGISIGAVSTTIHPYPTYLLGNRRAADQWYTNQLRSPLLGLLNRILAYRGTRKPVSEI